MTAFDQASNPTPEQASITVRAATDADRTTRTEAARRARKVLGDDQQLFGAPLQDARRLRALD